MNIDIEVAKNGFVVRSQLSNVHICQDKSELHQYIDEILNSNSSN